MAERVTTDVVICGAGAAGLTLAVDLARRGVNFRPVLGGTGGCAPDPVCLVRAMETRPRLRVV